MIAGVASLFLRHCMLPCVNKCPYVQYTHTYKIIKIGLENNKVFFSGIGIEVIPNVSPPKYNNSILNFSTWQAKFISFGIS